MADNAELISPVRTERPELTISAASINNEPAELDSTPASPERLRSMIARSASQPENISAEERERRAQLITERKADPAVLVDIPQTPGADELAKSGADATDEDAARSRTAQSASA